MKFGDMVMLLAIGVPLFLIFFLIFLLLKNLIPAMKKHPDEYFTIQTQRSVQELADQIQRVVGELSANVDKIQDDPLGNYGPAYEIAVVLSGKNRDFMRSSWAVQIFVVDSGDERVIELVALSEPATPYYNGIKISESRAMCEFIANRLTGKSVLQWRI